MSRRIVKMSASRTGVSRPGHSARMSGVCQLCFVPENGRKHEVHHIDYDKKNSHESNLITLCKSCHARTSIDRGFWTRHFQVRMES